MKLNVQYVSGEPKRISTKGHGNDAEYHFTIEDATARLVDIRAECDVSKGESSCSVSELNTAHDAVLKLPFIDRVTVWMKGRTDTTFEETADD